MAEQDDPTVASPDGADPAAQGLHHLQAAAKELIAAARAFLDVAEDLVEDPGAVTSALDVVGSLVRTAARAGRAVGSTSDAGDAPDAGVQRIRVG